ncbi:MAG: M23 family metallopeptidase [Chloroflexia bacterium]|nr:M23 family metallopeptidase [Chloroflexia bacterium]
MAPGTYDLSQPFGCVPRLLGYYPVVPGCPAEAPAVHDGLDFAAPEGTPIYAAAAGWVTAAGPDRASGIANTRIVVQHDGANEGYATEYIHWIATYVETGDYVQAGEAIAEVGSVGYSTGPHLHFTVVEFATNERIDPVRWLPATSQSGAYLGRLPGRDLVSFTRENVPVPDYADPAPPPVPSAQPVPAAPAAVDQAPATTPSAADNEPAAVEPTAAAPTPVPTAHVDRADAAGPSRNGRDDDKRDRRQRDEEPASTAEQPVPAAAAPPPLVPDVPLNPMVTTPVPAADGEDARKRKNKHDR